MADARYTRVPRITAERFGGEIFLLDEVAGRIHALNATAGAIWLLLEEPATADELLEDFASAFPGTSRNRLRRDLGEALAQMEKSGFIRKATAE
jgi:hypothetical protein